MKGFSYIELMVVMGLIIIIAVGSSVTLFRFTQTREPESAVRSIIATLRDAQQRSIVQQDGMYWGVQFNNNQSGRDGYILFKSLNQDGSSPTTITTVFMKSNLQFSVPAPANLLTIVFAKMTGRQVAPACVLDTESVIITVNGISTRVYCNGKIE